jgi:cyanophycinase-like exopeptidase
MVSYEEEWKEGWFKEIMADTGIKILDARNKNEIDETDGKVIFINGGINRYDLAHALLGNSKLLNLVKNADYIVSESSGSMVLGEKLRRYRAGEGDEIIDGVRLLKDVIIEPHYSQRNSQQLLKDDLAKSGMKYGVGIDSCTALVTDPKQFPVKWEKIGTGNVFIIHN